MKNNYVKIVGMLMLVFLMSVPLYAQEKMQVKKNQQAEPPKTGVVKKTTQVSKKDVATPAKPAHAAYKKEVRKPTAVPVSTGGTTVTTQPRKANTTTATAGDVKKEPRVKQQKPTIEQRNVSKKQYYKNQTVVAGDTIKPAKKVTSKPVQNPKKKLRPGDKIVGGDDYDIEQIPYQVWLGGCGGTIIGAEWVVTAAHCTPSVGDDIYAGMTSINAGASQMRTAIEVYIYEGFTGTVTGKDIALIRVNTPFDFNDPKVQPIPYATPADVANGLTDPCVPALVSGWGALSSGGGSPDHLQAVIVPLISNTLTDAAYVGWQNLSAGWITADQIGAGDYAPQNCSIGDQNGGEDSCQGDSGGPLVVPNAAGTGYILAGVVSWGESCADPDYPGLYARVSEFADWIEEVTGIVNNQYPNLIISEVVHGNEAGGTPRYVEIHNAGTEAYNLDNVAIRVFTDGASTPSATIDLPNVSLAAGATYVVSATAFETSWGGAFTTETPDLIHAGITGNGNDVYQLYDTETEGVIDVFGQIGSGNNYWDYEESIAVRNPWVIDANSGGFNEVAFDNEWTIENYEGIQATPGTHSAAIPAFDVTLVAITGLKNGQNFVGCDGTANVYPGLTLYNSGTGSISAVDVEINFNGTITTHTVNFSPALESGATSTVTLPGLSITTADEFTYTVGIDDENDGNPTNNKGEALTFSTLIFTDATTLNVNTTVDEYSPQENSWVIKDQAGNVIIESSTLAGAGIDMQTACVEDGTYTFTFIDNFGDGIFGGGLTVTLEDGTPIIVIDGEDPIFDNQCSFFGCPDPSERTITIPFTIPYVPTPDLSVELTNPVSSTFALTSCDTEFTPKFKVTNTGNIPVTEFAISYGVGSPTETASYDDILLQPGASLELTLEPVTLAAGANTLEVTLTDFNGDGLDGNATNDSDEATITLTVDNEINNIIVSITTDGYPEETSWEIRDASGNVVASSGGEIYAEEETTDIPVCLADGDYTFVLLDAYSDGIFVDNAVTLKTEAGTIFSIISGDFEDETTGEFSLPFVGATDGAIAILTPEGGASLENCTPLAGVTIVLTNEGTTPITSFVVEYGIGETTESIELEGLLLGGESAEVSLGNVTVATGSNTLNVSIIDVNGGGTDSNSENDTDASTFNFAVDTELTGLTVSVELDTYASETSWEIRNQDGDVIAESSSYAGLGNTTQTEVVCLPSGCYTFALIDSWGDGGASATLMVNGVPLSELGEGEYEELTTTICVGDVTYPVSNLIATGTSASEVTLTWEYGFDATQFAIFRSTTGATGSYALLATVPSSTLTYVSNGLQPQTQYFYSVIAIKSGENSIPMYTSATTQSSYIVDPENFTEVLKETLPANDGSWQAKEIDLASYAGEKILIAFRHHDVSDMFYIKLDNVSVGTPSGTPILTEGFEGSAFPPTGWTLLDQDSDTENWFQYSATGSAYEGTRSAGSASWLSTTGPLTPDNWLVTPPIDVAEGQKLYYYIAGQDPDFSDEVYSVMISPAISSGEPTPVEVPEPINFIATANSPFSVDLSWSYELTANTFELYSSATGQVGSFELVEILTGDVRTYTTSGLTPNTTYYFQLSAKIEDKTSVAATASATTPPAVSMDPADFTEIFKETLPANDGSWHSREIDLSAYAGEKIFIAFRHYDVSDIFYIKLDNVSVGTSSETPILSEGFEGNTFPPAGWALLDEDGDAQNWFQYSATASAYEGTRSAGSASWLSSTGPLTPDNWLVTPPIEIGEGQKLYYYIAGQDPEFSDEVYSVMISTVASTPNPPAAIDGLVAQTLTESSVKLDWVDESDNEDGFNVQVAYTATGPWVDYTPTVAANAETVTVSSSTFITYGENFFRVQAFNEAGASAWSSVVSATTNINQPTGFTALAISESEVELSWNDESQIEDGYRVEMATNETGPWTLVAETNENIEAHMVDELLPVTEYFFRVRSFNADGISDWSVAETTTLITGVEGSLSKSVNMYPNPTRTNSFGIKLTGQLGMVSQYTVTVFDSKGLMVDTFTAANQQEADQHFTLKNPAKGIYIVNINTGKQTVIKKLVVE
jgi:hypothetical protein